MEAPQQRSSGRAPPLKKGETIRLHLQPSSNTEHANILREMALVDSNGTPLENVAMEGVIVFRFQNILKVNLPAAEDQLTSETKNLELTNGEEEVEDYFVVVDGEIKTVKGLILPGNVKGYHRDIALAEKELKSEAGKNN